MYEKPCKSRRALMRDSEIIKATAAPHNVVDIVILKQNHFSTIQSTYVIQYMLFLTKIRRKILHACGFFAINRPTFCSRNYLKSLINAEIK